MDLLTAMRLFHRVVETGGFSEVARQTGQTQPTISRTIAALEDHLGVRLLNRSSRSMTLTDDGRQFLEQAGRALEAFAEAEASVGRRRGHPTGLLRVGTPVAFGRLHVAPRIAAFLDRHPDVTVDLSLSDAFVDLVTDGLDLAVRVGVLDDPSLIARRIGTTRRATVASAAYLARRGIPATPADLLRHDCIVYTRLATGSRWHFDGPEGPIVVTVSGRFRADNSEAVREGVIAGAGIGVVPVWLFRDEITTGRVQIVLDAFEPSPLPIHAVYPSRRLVAPKVRAMVEFLAAEFAASPVLSGRGDASHAATVG
ncbi:MAG: LysR family transcriptional regulator [Acetobacteraceae bacterium]